MSWKVWGVECPDSVFYKYHITACCTRDHEIKIKWWYRVVSIWIDTTEEGFRVHVKCMVRTPVLDISFVLLWTNRTSYKWQKFGKKPT